MSTIEVGLHLGGQSATSDTTATPRIITANERWALITQALQFNQLNVFRSPQEEEPGEDKLRVLVEAAAGLPGDIDAPDTPEVQAERSAIAEALSDDQLKLIARHGD